MWKKSKLVRDYFIVLGVVLIAFFIALPSTFSLNVAGREINFAKSRALPSFFGRRLTFDFPLKLGLDIAGGVQLTLNADMSQIASEDRLAALQAAVEIVRQRVDAYGLNEPIIQTSTSGDQYRIIVEIPGLDDVDQAVALIGTTAQLDFRLQNSEATMAATLDDLFTPTGLDGSMLERALATVDTNTRQQVVQLQFSDEGQKLFGDLTSQHIGDTLAIFIDGYPIMLPTINSAILDGSAVITGSFTSEQARALAIQLNSGALPVPLTILSQSQVGASLGEDSVRASVFAGIVGLVLIAIFMVLNYGLKGLLADTCLAIYCLIIIAVYKVFGVTMTLPAIAAVMISMGMAVDSNILVFSRMKEEELLGRTRSQARELSFGRAMDSIKDANFITLMIALILINPLDLAFLNSSGTIRGFGMTLFLGVIVGLFTGIFVTRTLTRVFIRDPQESERS
ncbi:protein translocase subunit SecD [bacterium]|nr:protein translocase subunit SecD [bacterium]